MSLSEADSGLTAMAMAGQEGRFQADSTLLVKFFMHPRLSEAQSADAGRPIYIDTCYIQIMQPGNKDSIVIRPATAMDKNRFAEHYRKWEARMGDDEEFVEGTLLTEWAGVSRAQVEELRYLNVRTVEQLAAMSDSNAQGIMGINGLKTKAARYIESAKDNATTEALEAANARIDQLMKMIELRDVPRETTEEPEKAEKPRRKRRTKAEMEAAQE